MKKDKEKRMNIKSIKPIRKNVLIQAYEWPDKTKGGIWMPDMMKYSPTTGGKDPWRGKILAIGDGVTQVKPGEIVRYQPSNYSRETVTENGVRYIIFTESLIYAVEDANENLIRALKNRVVFLPDEQLEKKCGRIYLPQIREERLLYGTIKAAGPNSGVKFGDRVIIENKNTWQYFDARSERYILTDRFNLLAIVYAYCTCEASSGHSAGTMRDGTDLIICNDCKGVLKISSQKNPVKK